MVKLVNLVHVNPSQGARQLCQVYWSDPVIFSFDQRLLPQGAGNRAGAGPTLWRVTLARDAWRVVLDWDSPLLGSREECEWRVVNIGHTTGLSNTTIYVDIDIGHYIRIILIKFNDIGINRVYSIIMVR